MIYTNAGEAAEHLQVKCANCHVANSVLRQAAWYQCQACGRYNRFRICITTSKSVTVHTLSDGEEVFRCPHCGSMHKVPALAGDSSAAEVHRRAGLSSATIAKIAVVAAALVIALTVGELLYFVSSLLSRP